MSHITALKFWLSRPGSAPKLRSTDTKLPHSCVPSSTIAKLHAMQPIHTLVSSPVKGASQSNATYHVWRTPLPARAFFHVARNVYVCSPELAFLQVAGTLPLVETIRLGYELCGNYSLDQQTDGGFFKREALTTPDKLLACCNAATRARGLKKARQAIGHVLPNAASPAETRLAMCIALPCRLGGLGLDAPQVNGHIPLSVRDKKLLGKSHFICDLYWPDRRVALEYDSDTFHTGADRISHDSQRRNALAHQDVTVLTMTAQTFRNVDAFNKTGRILAKHLGTSVRPRCADFELRQAALRHTLSNDPPWL